MLETKNLKFASRSLEPGTGARSDLGAVAGGAAVMAK